MNVFNSCSWANSVKKHNLSSLQVSLLHLCFPCASSQNVCSEMLECDESIQPQQLQTEIKKFSIRINRLEEDFLNLLCGEHHVRTT